MRVKNRPRGGGRPNVIPAKLTTHIFCEANNNIGRTKTGARRAVVQDICDFCLPEKITFIYLRRQWLAARKYGCKFMCPACAKEYVEREGFSGWKGTKIFVGRWNPIMKSKKNILT